MQAVARKRHNLKSSGAKKKHSLQPSYANKSVLKNKSQSPKKEFQKTRQNTNGTTTKSVKRSSDNSNERANVKKRKMDELSVKERRKERKQLKPNYELAQKCKKLWEGMRCTNLPREKKYELCDKALDLVRGKMKDIIFRHDTVRVVQSLVKYGNNEHREIIFQELKVDILEMVKSKYAKFLVKKLFKYGNSTQRSKLFECFYGNVKQLLKHKDAAEVLEVAFNDYANKHQRCKILEEFYGSTYALFKSEEPRTLDEIIEANPEKLESILLYLKDTLCKLMDKQMCVHSIVHKLFLEYFTFVSSKDKQEMIEIVRGNLVHMLHTRDGAHVAMKCLWHGTAKDRKIIMKSLKTYVVKVCKEEHGHLVLLALFDSVDDTKLVCKIILDEMLKEIDDVVKDNYGKKVLLYLVSRRDPLFFQPDIIKVLQEGDDNPHSKKDPHLRFEELRKYVSSKLLIILHRIIGDLLGDNKAVLFLTSLLSHIGGNRESVLKNLCQFLYEPFVTGKGHVIENAAVHVALKQMISNDRERMERKDCGPLFSEILVSNAPENTLKSWVTCNRGSFLLVALVELGNTDITEKVKRDLSNLPKTNKNKGAEILFEKLSSV